MPEDYIDEVVKAVLEGRKFREYVLRERHKRTLKALERLILYIAQSKLKFHTKDWWKEKLILEGEDKRLLVWCGGLNEKTIHNWMGSATLDVCREACAVNYDVMVSLFKALPKSFPKLSMKISIGERTVELNEVETLLLLFSVISAGGSIRGGIWSEVGKRAGPRILERLFDELGIPKGALFEDFYYQLEIVDGGRETDAEIFYKGKRIHRVEIKLLGIGNPEIGNEAIARQCDIFLVDDLTSLMIEQARRQGVKVILLKNAKKELYEMFSKEGLPVKKPHL
jgi:hypothetical protein